MGPKNLASLGERFASAHGGDVLDPEFRRGNPESERFRRFVQAGRAALLLQDGPEQGRDLADRELHALVISLLLLQKYRGMIDPGIEMVLQDEQRHLSERRSDRGGLLQFLAAIAIVLDHLAQPADLALDAGETR
jgi:hypothetical protein